MLRVKDKVVERCNLRPSAHTHSLKHSTYIVQLVTDQLGVLDNDVFDYELGCLEQLAALFASVLCSFLLTDVGCRNFLALPTRVSTIDVKQHCELTLEHPGHHTRPHRPFPAVASIWYPK